MLQCIYSIKDRNNFDDIILLHHTSLSPDSDEGSFQQGKLGLEYLDSEIRVSHDYGRKIYSTFVVFLLGHWISVTTDIIRMGYKCKLFLFKPLSGHVVYYNFVNFLL